MRNETALAVVLRFQSGGLRSVEDELAIRRANPDMLKPERFSMLIDHANMNQRRAAAIGGDRVAICREFNTAFLRSAASAWGGLGAMSRNVHFHRRRDA